MENTCCSMFILGTRLWSLLFKDFSTCFLCFLLSLSKQDEDTPYYMNLEPKQPGVLIKKVPPPPFIRSQDHKIINDTLKTSFWAILFQQRCKSCLRAISLQWWCASLLTSNLKLSIHKDISLVTVFFLYASKWRLLKGTKFANF